MIKKVMTISILGMLAGFACCVAAGEQTTWFAIGFAFFLGNISLFYLALKHQVGCERK